MKRSIIAFAILALVCLSCRPKVPFLESRARQQLPVTIEYDLNRLKDKMIQDLKTVYVNDSICLLQFHLQYKNGSGDIQVQDVRYTYLIDFVMSHYSGEIVYKELMEFMTCMPDEYIKKNWQYVDATGESVYSYLYGGAYPIVHPFDEKQN